MNDYTDYKSLSLKKNTYIRELKCDLVELSHKGSGAKIYILEREDSNKTFGIGFRTIPTDDTGVFHILEHSVLCGSDKFPIKDPFTELIKSSAATFINAMTYGEKTLYPVSSKNDTAFRGLVDVYMDAVLHPLAMKDPSIFMQEGIRYEINDEGKLDVNGIVYNEMQGAYASADEYAYHIQSGLMYPNGTYMYDSGGHPDAIPALTYESFKSTYNKFYHPSNSVIFLDGSVKYDEILPLITSYLDEYEKIDFHPAVYDGTAIIDSVVTDSFPVDNDEDTKDKTRVYLGYRSFPYAEPYKNTALSLICEAIADSNNAPLTKKVLSSGTVENFSFHASRSLHLNSLDARFIGVKDGCEDKAVMAYKSAISEMLENGIPKDRLKAALSHLEFATREADYGSYPKGILYMTACAEAYCFDTDPAVRFTYEEKFDFLRKMLDTDYYDELLKEVVSAPHTHLIMHPDKAFNVKRGKYKREQLDAKMKSLNESDISRIKADMELFKLRQCTPDTEEGLLTIPRLRLEDLSTIPDKIPTRVESIDGVEVMIHDIPTGGIYYSDILFDVSDASDEEKQYIRLYNELSLEWDTDRYSAADFDNLIKIHTGGLRLYERTAKNGDDVKMYVDVALSCLEKQADTAIDLADEHIYHRCFDNGELLDQVIRQIYTSLAEYTAYRGENFAQLRSAARYSRIAALEETIGGYSFTAFVKGLISKDCSADDIFARLATIRDKYFRRERLTLAITGENAEAFARSIISKVRPGGAKAKKAEITLYPRINEGIVIPSSVSCVATATNLYEFGEKSYTGAFAVLSNILTNEILWDAIRVNGGAYGTGISIRSNSGTVVAHSYADPTPKSTAEFFSNIKHALDAYLDSAQDITKFIIGAVGSMDTVSTPRSEGELATTRYLSGITYDDILRIRHEAINSTKEEFYRLSSLLGKIMEISTYTTVGPRNEIESDESIQAILEI